MRFWLQIGWLSLQVLRPGVNGVAPLAILRSRSYMRVVQLPRGYAFTIDWLGRYL